MEVTCVQPQDYAPSACNNAGMPPIDPYLEALEMFNPNFQNDAFNWIPGGIFQDLRDNTPNEFNELRTIDDQVSGFTNFQLFQAITSYTRSPQAYRDNLLVQNGNSQFTQVHQLFNAYNYN